MGQEGFLRGTRVALIVLLLCQAGALFFELQQGATESSYGARLVRQRAEEEQGRRVFWQRITLKVEAGLLDPEDVAVLTTPQYDDDEEL
jgi:hypothetical protein